MDIIIDPMWRNIAVAADGNTLIADTNDSDNWMRMNVSLPDCHMWGLYSVVRKEDYTVVELSERE